MTERIITFDGMDYNEKGQLYIVTPTINIWKDWGARGSGIVCSVHHGATGTLLEKRGQRCKVQVGEHVGFVTFFFIRGLKDAWLAKRRQDMASQREQTERQEAGPSTRFNLNLTPDTLQFIQEQPGLSKMIDEWFREAGTR